MLRTTILLFLLAASATPATAETCRGTVRDKPGAAERDACKPAERVQPYDPDRVRAGARPGFIDLGGGTEVRVGGRVRMDYDARGR